MFSPNGSLYRKSSLLISQCGAGIGAVRRWRDGQGKHLGRGEAEEVEGAGRNEVRVDGQGEARCYGAFAFQGACMVLLNILRRRRWIERRFWWSPHSKYIAFTEVDSPEIPIFRIMHQGKSYVGSDAQENHAYPVAGATNAKVRLGVISSCGREVTWMDLLCCGKKDMNSGEEEYFARVNWMADDTLIAWVLNRAHSKLKILKFDIRNGQREVLLVELNVWITLHDCFTPLDKGTNKFSGGFI